MNKNIVTGALGTLLSAMGMTTTNEVLETISLVLTIAGGIITLIVIPIITWYNNAKKDGKITKEEFKDGVETLKKGIDEVSKDIKKKEDKDND